MPIITVVPCKCGNDRFYLTKEGVTCTKCGSKRKENSDAVPAVEETR